MNIRGIVVGVALATLGATAGVATGSHVQASRTHTASVQSNTITVLETSALGVRALVSEQLGLSSRGPYRARPVKIEFDQDLWIDHLKWVDWGQPVAFASGVVHASAGPSYSFTTTAGGIMLDKLQSCATGSHSYYTYASMLAPAGFPDNTESMAGGEAEQAPTPC